MTQLSALRFFVASGLVAVSALSGAQAATTYEVDLTKPTNNFGDLDQNDVTACKNDPNGNYACGPTAAANGLAYLQRQFSALYGTSLVPDSNKNNKLDTPDILSLANLLAGADYMSCQLNICNNGPSQFGTKLTGFFSGKIKYLNEVAPGKTYYTAMSHYKGAGIPKELDMVAGDWPTFSFMYDYLLKGAAIEILLQSQPGKAGSNHYMTLTSLHWTDTNMDKLVDKDEKAFMDFIDPATGKRGEASIYITDAGYIGTDYKGGESYIYAANVELPVPEPEAWLLALFGAAVLTQVARRRR